MRNRGEISKEQSTAHFNAQQQDKFLENANEQILVNCSNHPQFSDDQLNACKIQDGFELQFIQFPNVPPSATESDIHIMAQALAQDIRVAASVQHKIYVANHNRAFPGVDLNPWKPFSPKVHIMGEATLVSHVLFALRGENVCCASTTERLVTEEFGVKTSTFKFVQFRNYSKLD